MENGELHSTKMASVRDILNDIMIYVWGRKKPKRGKGNRSIDAKESVRDEDGGLLFDSALFSAVLTLRHQINSISRALEIADRRFAEIEASRDTVNDPGASLNVIERLVLYPLRDWRNELERRLEFGDYRPHNESIRRPTGEILRTPRMPKFSKTMTGHERMHALIEAAAPFARGKRDPDNEKRLLAKAFSSVRGH